MLHVRDLSIKAKLSAGFGLSAVLIFAIGAVSLVQLRELNGLAAQVATNWLPEVAILSEIKRGIEEHGFLVQHHFSATDPRAIVDDSARLRTIEAELDKNIQRLAPIAAKYPGESDITSRLADAWAAHQRSLAAAEAFLAAGDIEAAKKEYETAASLAYSKASRFASWPERPTASGVCWTRR